MRKRKLVALILVIFAMFFLISRGASEVVVVAQDGVSANATKLFTPGALLDDFNAGSTTNAWNCVTGTFAKEGSTASCNVSYDSSVAYGGTGRSLKLVYNVDALNSYAGYSSQMGSGNLTSLGTPPVICTAVSFYVKGAVGGEFFKIQLKNTSTASYWDANNATNYNKNVASVYINDYHPDGGVTTSWRKVTVPFHNFVNLDDWAHMKEFVIVFENSQSTVNDSPTSGTIYIDDIKFEATTVSTVRIDHFGDKVGSNSLGGGIGLGVQSGANPESTGNKYAFSNGLNEYDPAVSYPYGMRIDYNVNTEAYAYTFLIFGGGYVGADTLSPKNLDKSGWIAIPHDFSAYTKITFRVRAETEAKNPKTMKLELAYGEGNDSLYVLIDAPIFGGPITTNWQTHTIELFRFGILLDTKKIKKLTFTFEGWRIVQATGSKVGTVFIDSVQFE